MNRCLLNILLIFLVMCVSACFCPLTSVNPLSNPQYAAYDGRLGGVWRLVSKNDGRLFVHFGKGENNKTDMISIEHRTDGRIHVAAFSVFSTVTSAQNYLNFHTEELFEEFGKEMNGYTFMRYQQPDTDTLDLSLIDEDLIVEAIKSGLLKGEITYRKTAAKEGKKNRAFQPNKNRSIKCARLTDSSKNIFKYFQSVEPDKLFPHPIRFKRVK